MHYSNKESRPSNQSTHVSHRAHQTNHLQCRVPCWQSDAHVCIYWYICPGLYIDPKEGDYTHWIFNLPFFLELKSNLLVWPPLISRHLSSIPNSVFPYSSIIVKPCHKWTFPKSDEPSWHFPLWHRQDKVIFKDQHFHAVHLLIALIKMP